MSAGELIPRRGLATTTLSMAGFRAVVLQGARQVGKSTLATIVARDLDAQSVSLDLEEDLSGARDDPVLFLHSLGAPAVIDEVQRGGDRLVLALNQRLDQS
ncbi:MAG: AAA family ATPase, partial [Acidimicrobiales bacterium]